MMAHMSSKPILGVYWGIVGVYEAKHHLLNSLQLFFAQNSISIPRTHISILGTKMVCRLTNIDIYDCFIIVLVSIDVTGGYVVL